MGNLNDAQKNPKQVAEQLGVGLVDPQTPKATGVCSCCKIIRRIKYKNINKTFNTKLHWINNGYIDIINSRSCIY